MVYIDENEQGEIDLNDLESKLEHFKNTDNTKIGVFSAASNITGILVDTNKITILLHKYNALAFWDYATAAPYVEINMNPIDKTTNNNLVYKDAIYFSMHKFIGGPGGSPGILIVKKNLLQNQVPETQGGGTVFFVTKYDHRYLKNEELREEAGTPSIIGDIRAGLLFQLKSSIGIQNIINKEQQITKHTFEFMSKIKNLIILGPQYSIDRLSIFSFLIQHEQTGYYLHSNFVTSLLNDLFGIQTRSGCLCAGPYSQYLLGISYDLAKTYEHFLVQDERLDRSHLRLKHDSNLASAAAEILRPGFTRFNLAFFFDQTKIDFILNAFQFVSQNGWKFLPWYTFNLETGEWRHINHQVFKDRKWLGNINYKNGQFNYVDNKIKSNYQIVASSPANYQDYFDAAFKVLDEAVKTFPQLADQRLIFDSDNDHLRWFLLPSEALGLLTKNKSLFNQTFQQPIFTPRTYHKANNQVKFSEFMQEQSISCVKIVKKINNLPAKSNSIKPKIICNLPKPKSSIIQINDNYSLSFVNPPKSIFKLFVNAIYDFNMIKNNDRILIGLSGGKDSLSLLHLIKQFQFVCKSKNINFDFGCVTIDPQTKSYNPSGLKTYLAHLNVKYFYEEQCIMESASAIDVSSICSYCSRMKRGRIYSTARKNGYNVVALGHHLDDFAER
jgi:selenocysteine lyase/cysteine desulfurase